MRKPGAVNPSDAVQHQHKGLKVEICSCLRRSDAELDIHQNQPSEGGSAQCVMLEQGVKCVGSVSHGLYWRCQPGQVQLNKP